MILTEVKNKKSKRDFLNVAREIYKNDLVWICPLDKDIEAVFDPKKNNFHQQGSCVRWVLKSDDGKLIGRVAAFINQNKKHNAGLAIGGMGFLSALTCRKLQTSYLTQLRTG